ncbi:hypothetical protein JTB14_000779 [Gonioctena quinquepunctata]|nr:hypothetical protein JTB14_000779 [Gonioctena quinquepunctata]
MEQKMVMILGAIVFIFVVKVEDLAKYLVLLVGIVKRQDIAFHIVNDPGPSLSAFAVVNRMLPNIRAGKRSGRTLCSREVLSTIIPVDDSWQACWTLGYFKTNKRVAFLYYWPGMNSDMARFLPCCDVCEAQKPEQKLAHVVMGRRTVSRQWELICTDLMGPFPVSKKINRFILVVCDVCTKNIPILLIKSATSEAIVNHIEKDVFMIYGAPARIICDEGRQYVSETFKDMATKYDSKILFNANYHPQANPTERVNRAMKTMIRSYLNQDHRSWDSHLHEFGYALQTAVHEITGYSPVYLNFDRKINLSGKLHRRLSSLADDNNISISSREELSDHVKKLKQIQS